MADAIWLLWDRALVDYAKAATVRLLSWIHRGEAEKQTATTSQPEPDDPE